MQPYGAFTLFFRWPEGVQGASGKPPASITRDNFAARNSPLMGPDAPTPARGKGLQPYGALTLFFRWRKKSVQKKASGTATPGKSPLLPIFERGSSQCRAQHSWTANIYVRARSCSLFSSFKKGKAFSLRCLSPLCSPQLAAGIRIPCKLGCFDTVGKFCGVDEWADFLHPVGCGAGLPPLRGGMLQCGLEIFATQKASGIFKPCWPQIAEKRPVFFRKRGVF